MVSPPIIEYLPVNEDGSANQEEAKRVMAINNLNHGITRIRLDELQAWVRELVDARSRDPNPPPE